MALILNGARERSEYIIASESYILDRATVGAVSIARGIGGQVEFPDGAHVYLCARYEDPNYQPHNYEFFVGEYNDGVVTRVTVLQSSNGDNPVSWEENRNLIVYGITPYQAFGVRDLQRSIKTSQTDYTTTSLSYEALSDVQIVSPISPHSKLYISFTTNVQSHNENNTNIARARTALFANYNGAENQVGQTMIMGLQNVKTSFANGDYSYMSQTDFIELGQNQLNGDGNWEFLLKGRVDIANTYLLSYWSKFRIKEEE